MHEPEATMSSTRIETLKEEIDAKKAFIASIPLCRDEKDVLFLAKHQQILGENEEEYELLLEAQRRVDVVREHEELHPPYTEECPICLEDIRVGRMESMRYFLCCGKGYCKKCDESASALTDEGVEVMSKCPMCGGDFPHAGDEEGLMRLQARNGKPWAQMTLGDDYLEGVGFPPDVTEATKWFELAAEQGHPHAFYRLATIHQRVDENIAGPRPSPSEARALMKKAADLGVLGAQINLGVMYLHGTGGPVDVAKTAYYATLAYSQELDPRAAYHLGFLFFNGSGGLCKSLYRAKYYIEQSAEKRYEDSCTRLAMTLGLICKAQYDGRTVIPGHSCIPKVLHWARKAVSNGDPTAKDAVAEIEESGMRACANCRIDSLTLPERLKKCSRCKAVWYCARNCQVKHWKLGHKIDCIQQE